MHIDPSQRRAPQSRQPSESSKPEPCPRCGFRYQCLCNQIPSLSAKLSLLLLTHPNEQYRDTNTGRLLSQTLPNCQSVLWRRGATLAELMPQPIKSDQRPVLLFPRATAAVSTESLQHSGSDHTRALLFILLDATWQEAGKMLRQTPWLDQLPSYQLSIDQPSNYTLRRNQSAGNLCSCEVGQALLSELGYQQDARQLADYFNIYQRVFSADRSGHRLR